mmetsp:Transcript_11605/g.37115  ORF Transcript_11605/g.37115 Transcript_11605/m.37115 type:complete len:83 (-) Transcript_11605:898-1146(-)
MITFGGYNGAERLNDMHEYSFATSLWTQLDVSVGDVPSGRSSLISQVYCNSLFIFGGLKLRGSPRLLCKSVDCRVQWCQCVE